MKKLLGLQYLRALAALAVVMFHACGRMGHLFLIGEAGVDLFFILSGFLMVSITDADTRPVAFMADRIRRIVPSYWIATSVMLFGGLTGLFPNLALQFWHIAASYLFIPARPVGGERIWPLLVPGWTLNYEMFFYLLFALSMLFLSSQKMRIAVLSLIFLCLVAARSVLQPQATILQFYGDPMLFEFAAGGWLGLLWKSGTWPRWLGWPAIGLGTVAFLILAVLHPTLMGEILLGVTARLLVAGMLGLERADRVRRIPALLILGDASYSIYLWHTMAISLIVSVGTRLHLSNMLLITLSVAGGAIVGVIAFRLIETPFLRYFRERRYVHGVPVPSGP